MRAVSFFKSGHYLFFSYTSKKEIMKNQKRKIGALLSIFIVFGLISLAGGLSTIAVAKEQSTATFYVA